MGGLCATRNRATMKAENATKDCGLPSPANKTEVTSKVACSTPTPLPMKSWRALLEDTKLNGEAVPFQPAFQKSTDRVAPVHAPIKRFEPPGLPKPSIETAPVPEKDGADCGNSVVTIQTQTYLKLLKEGGQKKKSLGTGSAKHASLNPKSDLQRSDQMTVASLKQTWQRALKGKKDDEQDERAETQGMVQDDISLAKSSADKDLSEPVYWSETESTDRTLLLSNASAHRLGRRQACTIRSYVMQDLSFQLDRTVAMMLSRLQLFEKQLAFNQEAQTQRRFVAGLKEVGRRLKQSKVRCLIVAPDLEGDSTKGGLDDRVREVIAMSYERNVPVIFALSRSRLGLALGKSMTVSLLGILDATGAKELFDSVVGLGAEARQSWLARLPQK